MSQPKMCSMTIVYEFISTLFVLMTPVLKYRYGWTNTYFTDPVCLFVIIPFLQLMNDDDTKDIIFNENWFQAIKYILGIYIPSSQIKVNNFLIDVMSEKELVIKIDPNHRSSVGCFPEKLPNTNEGSLQMLTKQIETQKIYVNV